MVLTKFSKNCNIVNRDPSLIQDIVNRKTNLLSWKRIRLTLFCHYLYEIKSYLFPILLFSFLQCTRFVQSVCSLIQQVSLLVSSTKQTKVREEWKEFFASSIFPILLELFVVIATNTNIATEDKECVLSDLGESH